MAEITVKSFVETTTKTAGEEAAKIGYTVYPVNVTEPTEVRVTKKRVVTTNPGDCLVMFGHLFIGVLNSDDVAKAYSFKLPEAKQPATEAIAAAGPEVMPVKTPGPSPEAMEKIKTIVDGGNRKRSDIGSNKNF